MKVNNVVLGGGMGIWGGWLWLEVLCLALDFGKKISNPN